MQKRRLIYAIAVAGALQCAAGCAAWHTRNWDFSHARDPRAVDIDRRLQQSLPPVERLVDAGARAGSGARAGADDE